MANTSRGLTRLVAELTGSSSPGARPQCWVETGVIKDVVTGYYTDSIVTATWRGAVVPVSYLASYTPNPGDTVLLLIQPSAVIVLDRLIGPTGESS